MLARAVGNGHDRGVTSLRVLPALLLTALLALGTALLGVPVAHGEEPAVLTERVTDHVAALTPEQHEQVERALATLSTESDLQLFVVFTDSFAAHSGQEWSDITAVQSALGARDVLLAIAVDDSEFGLSVEASLQLTNEQLDRVEAAVATQVAAGSPTQAAIVAADELRVALEEGPGGSVVLLVVIIAVMVGAVVVWVVRRS